MTARKKLAAFVAMSLLVASMIAARPRAHAAECDTTVTAPANLQNALNAAGTGATVCLNGTFLTGATIRPLAHQTVVGGTLQFTGSYDVCKSCYANMVNGYDLHAGGITLDGVEVGYFEGLGARCGHNATIRDSYFHDNKRAGIFCIAQNLAWHLVITGNRLIHNGTPVLEGYGAGGMKLMEIAAPGNALGAGATITANVATDNIGNGLWLDRSSSATVISGNTTARNSRNGIRCEKCPGPISITGNTSFNNGDYGIVARVSAVVAMAGNTTYSNGAGGIAIADDARVGTKTYPTQDPTSEGYHIKTITIADTRLVADRVRGCDLAGVACVA
jgi:hypothetical protein